jgi:hypothetical protein
VLSASVARGFRTDIRSSILKRLRSKLQDLTGVMQSAQDVLAASDLWLTMAAQKSSGNVEIVSSDSEGIACGETDLQSLLYQSMSGAQIHGINTVDARVSAGLQNVVFSALSHLFSQGEQAPSERSKVFIKSVFPLVAPLCDGSQCERLCASQSGADFLVPIVASVVPTFPFANFTSEHRPHREGRCKKHKWEWAYPSKAWLEK